MNGSWVSFLSDSPPGSLVFSTRSACGGLTGVFLTCVAEKRRTPLVEKSEEIALVLELGRNGR